MRNLGPAGVVVVVGAACSQAQPANETPSTGGGNSSSLTGDPVSTSGAEDSSETSSANSTTLWTTTDAMSSSSDGSTGGPPPVVSWSPAVLDYQLRCKLISGADIEDPTANDTHHRANLRGTDLGIPLVVDDQLLLFFGDTQGYRTIWMPGEDPDTVGRVDAAQAREDPGVLCDSLEFLLTADDPSVAAASDPSILRDFAASTMLVPPGEVLSDYIGDSPPPFPNIPGTFEVPTGALRIGDDVYTWWAGKTTFDPRPQMTLSYLARWDRPRTLPNHQIIRPFDALEGGALGGHFLQAWPIVLQESVYVLGTGDYRFGGVSLMRFPVAEIETGDEAAVFDPSSGTWVDTAGADPGGLGSIPTLFEDDGVGELGGVFLEASGVFIVMYQRELHDRGGAVIDNRVVLRTAAQLEGPWSDAVTVIDMADPAFTAQHCCGADGCQGNQILNCFVAGLYAIYPLPSPTVTTGDDGTLDVDLAFVASTWNPYNVVLFETQVEITPGF
ncbi:MAG: DUF4185 domain-containing protein [Nannocystales bacterium]